MQQLLEVGAPDKKIYLITDNARWHHAKALAELLEEHKDKLTLWFLPPYSPELNPQERVWRHTRRKVTHNKYFDKKEDLINAVESKFLEWRSPNVELSNLCVNKKLPKKSNKDNY